MRYYFQLQMQRFRRIINNTGIPLILFLLFILTVYYFAYYAIKEFKYSPYALLILSIFILEKTNQKNRLEFLKSLFVRSTEYIKIRCIENIILLLPILLLAAITGLFWTIPIILIIGIAYAIINKIISFTSNTATPTPYGKYPFEMIRFFRMYLFPNSIAIFLFVMGIISKNDNLTLFGIALIPMLIIGHLEYVEPVEVLWNYTHKPTSFLFHKIKTELSFRFVFI